MGWNFNMRGFVIGLVAVWMMTGCGTALVIDADTSASSATTQGTKKNIAVTGATTQNCTVTGAYGQEIGSGAAVSIAYTITTEQSAVVHCGDLSSVFPVSSASVDLTPKSSQIADLLKDTSMRQGTRLIVNTMEGLDGSSTEGKIVMKSMAEFMTALDALEKSDSKSDDTTPASKKTLTKMESESESDKEATRVQNIITVLINMGQPVVIQNIGANKTITACTNSAAQTLSANAITADASVIGITGCLVYHQLYAWTDLNDPLFVPDNIPATFRTIATENGVVTRLAKAKKKKLTLTSVHNFIFTTLGHTGSSEDDEGVVTSRTVAVSDLRTFFTNLLSSLTGSEATVCETHKSFVCHVPPGNPSNTHTICISNSAVDTHLGHGDSMGRCTGDFTSDDFKAYRYHTGYNPSGGKEINLAAAKTSNLPAACNDSNASTVCSVQPLHFNFDETTLTQEDNGPYVLMMEYRGGGFLNQGWVIKASNHKPYRDANFQNVKVTITASDDTAIDYAHLLYQSALDPMQDNAGNSAPFSNAAWRVLYPNMANVDNAYRFPNPEVVAKFALILNGITDLDQLSLLQAFVVLKTVKQGMAAIPLVSDVNAILADHGKTLTQWDALATAWLATGTGGDSD